MPGPGRIPLACATAQVALQPIESNRIAIMHHDTQRYATKYSTKRLQWTLKRYCRKAGMEVVERALTLYYTARAPETPTWCKTAIYGALGYFISLVDGIPDLTPVLGYTDDLAVMAAALTTLARHVTPEIKAKANAQAQALFGQADESQAFPPQSSTP